jgi:hypothetical protein
METVLKPAESDHLRSLDKSVTQISTSRQKNSGVVRNTHVTTRLKPKTQKPKFPLITRKIKLHRNTMNTITLGLRSLAAGLVLAGTIAIPQLSAVDAFSDAVGYTTLNIVGPNTDNIMSLPMVRNSVFAGTVAGSITANSFNVNAGVTPPTWTANQWVYSAGIQPLTYYLEITSGALQGLYYKITANGTSSLTLDMEGDSLTSHPLAGNPTAALAAGDSIKIRPYWRIKDVLENGGSPVIAGWPDPDTTADEVLIPNYESTAQNKAANLALHYDLSAPGWRAFGDDFTDMGTTFFVPMRRLSSAVARGRRSR